MWISLMKGEGTKNLLAVCLRGGLKKEIIIGYGMEKVMGRMIAKNILFGCCMC